MQSDPDIAVGDSDPVGLSYTGINAVEDRISIQKTELIIHVYGPRKVLDDGMMGHMEHVSQPEFDTPSLTHIDSEFDKYRLIFRLRAGADALRRIRIITRQASNSGSESVARLCLMMSPK